MIIGTKWAFRRRPVSQFFYDFGMYIRVILICGFVITSLFYPALAIYFSHQPLSHFSTRILDSLFLPSANDAFHHNDLHDFWQGYDDLRIRTDAAARARCGTEHTVRVERLFIPSTIPDPFGALNLQTLMSALDLQTTLETHLTPELPCVRLLDNTSPATPPSHKCLVVSPTAHWNDDANIIATDPHLYTSLNKAHRNMEAVLATSISLPIRRRIAEGLQKAGVSITLKLTTYNAVLGTIAYFSSGAIRQFCVFVIVVLVAHWFLPCRSTHILLGRFEHRLAALGGSSSPRSASHALDQRRSRTRFGIRRVFKTKAARNVSLMLLVAITGGLYYYSGPRASSRAAAASSNAFETERQTIHHLTPTQSVSTPHTAPYHPASHTSHHLPVTPASGLYYYSGPRASSRAAAASSNAFETERQTIHHLTPTQSSPLHPPRRLLSSGARSTLLTTPWSTFESNPLSPSTSVIIWRTLNPPNDPLVHIRIEPPVLVLLPQTDMRENQAKPMGWGYRVRRLRPVLWTLKVLVLPIAATLAALYGLLLHLLRNSELRAAQRDRIDSLIEGDAEEHEREKEKEREKEEEEKKIAGTFTTLPRGSRSDLVKIQSSRDGKVVAAVSVEGTVLVWSEAKKERNGAGSPGRVGQASGSASNGSKTVRPAPMVIPTPVAGIRATSLAIDSKGKRLAVAGGGVIQSLDVSQGSPVLGGRLLQNATEPGSMVRDLKFLRSKQSEQLGPFPTSFTSTQPSPKHTLLAAYDDGTVLEWDCDSGTILARVVPRYAQSQASLFVRETFVAIAFSNPDGHIDVYRRHLDNDRVVSYTPVMSPKVPGVIAIDVHEWSLGMLLATLTATGHAAVWGTNAAPIVEMDLALTSHDETSSLPTNSSDDGRIVLLPAPQAPPPCRQCGLPPSCTFTVAFSFPSATGNSSNHNPTVYIRRASVLYQPGRCSCQPISIASTLAGPRVISFGFPSGVRVVSGLGIGGVNGGAATSEFPVSVHGLRRASSSYGRHSFESSSSTGTEDLTPDASKDYSGFLGAVNGSPAENGHSHGPKHVVGSDVRWEQHTIEESCEHGQWEVIGTRVVGIRRKSRVYKPSGENCAPGSSAAPTKQETLPNSVLERWEVWQVDTATTELPRGASTLSRLCEGNEVTPARATSQSGETPESRRSPHISRILRLGRAAEAQSSPSPPSSGGGHAPMDPRDISYPRLPFTRVYSTNASYDRLFTALGNTIGVLRLDHPTTTSGGR
ncbi:hypothetical protein RSAG8_00172, partial [Rhizoctonia solani AG-8 WAC10335]